jgi:hypothetical protein
VRALSPHMHAFPVKPVYLVVLNRRRSAHAGRRRQAGGWRDGDGPGRGGAQQEEQGAGHGQQGEGQAHPCAGSGGQWSPACGEPRQRAREAPVRRSCPSRPPVAGSSALVRGGREARQQDRAADG